MVHQTKKRGESDYYILVVDTNQYSGDFEREMCAYMTGQVGDCEVSEEEALRARQEIPTEVEELGDLIDFISDESGNSRPVESFPNPRYGNSGEDKYALLDPLNETQYPWPAYFSVAIYFHAIPPAYLLKVLQERAYSYASERNLLIERFRFLEQRTVYTEIPLTDKNGKI